HEDSYGFAGFSTVYFDLWNRDSDIAMTAYVGLEGGSMESFCQQWAGFACPCGHNPALGGCPNSSHPSGATLNGSGASSTQNDSVTFAFADMPPNVNCLLFQGTSVSSALTFGDGMRCIGTPTIRFPMRAASGAGTTGYGAAY